jgi:hypothetical protein
VAAPPPPQFKLFCKVQRCRVPVFNARGRFSKGQGLWDSFLDFYPIYLKYHCEIQMRKRRKVGLLSAPRIISICLQYIVMNSFGLLSMLELLYRVMQLGLHMFPNYGSGSVFLRRCSRLYFVSLRYGLFVTQ